MSRPTGPRNPSPLAGSPKPLSTPPGLIRPGPASRESWCGRGARTQRGQPRQGREEKGGEGGEDTLIPSSQPPPLSQVWFQNRRSKERRMKQLSALGARRHAFFRSPRRMRPLGGRLDESEMLGSTPYTYYGGKGRPGIRCSAPALFWELRAKGPGRRAFRRRTSPTLWTHNHGHMYTHPHLLDTKSDTWSHSHSDAHRSTHEMQ